MNELKAETIINAGIRIAEKNLTSAYIVKRGDEQAGAIFVKIDTLDGFAKLFSRNIKYDLNNDKADNLSNHAGYMTETLAKLYLNQKNYEKAIQSYKILILKFPEKNSYFADQIKKIKSLKKLKK